MTTLPSPSTPLHRLQQTLLQIDPYTLPPYPNISLVSGPLTPPLLTITLSRLLTQQASRFGSRECLIIPWTGARWTYQRLKEESDLLARALLRSGIRPGERIGIMAGNCEKYVAVFFAAARVGAVLVVLNNTYTAEEAVRALSVTKCKFLFTTPTIARHDNTPLLSRLKTGSELDHLETIILLRDNISRHGFIKYENLLYSGRDVPPQLLDIFEGIQSPFDVVNLQFTSGSTGNPKAAMLTHHNLINNSRFIGDRMNLTPHDILCCPPPLFHCFGLTLGLLATLTHGGKIVYPAEAFDAHAVLHAISDEKCTALHGVPAMFESILALPRPEGWSCEKLRTGIVAGSPVPRALMERMVGELGMAEFVSSYGLTEASPTVFNAHTTDSIHTRLTTVGTILPHARAKIVDRSGRIVPIGVRGELCVAGYQLQRGYWENAEKTAEVMKRDEQGEMWLHTGDEAVFDVDGYCSITGRFKDIIIRGGENIYPLEIEERLAHHPAISRAIVVGAKHPRYVEVPAAFLQLKDRYQKPGLDEIKSWVRQYLGRHKAPAHVFWLGEDCDAEVPLTGSGKIKKFELRKVAEEIMGVEGADA